MVLSTDSEQAEQSTTKQYSFVIFTGTNIADNHADTHPAQLPTRSSERWSLTKANSGNLFLKLINGEIVPRNYPSASHQRVLLKLTLLFGNYVEASKLGEVLFAPFGVVLDRFDDVQPDLMFVSTARQEIIQEDGIFGVPDLVLEIISPSSIKTDRGKKFRLYERMNVPEYWIVESVRRCG